MTKTGLNTEILDNIIVGRVEPHIYAFTTGTVPNYLKVGDTYRPVSVRIGEWAKIYENLKHIYTQSARIDDNTIFRDYSVHEFLINSKSRRRLMRGDIPGIPYSNEFFEGATTADVDEAIEDIRKSAQKNDGRYQLYTPAHLPKTTAYPRGKSFSLRPNQKEVIKNFVDARKHGRDNLLMFAVMRFGKSFTSMCCAKCMDAKSVLVVSAKADVRDEWKKTVQSIGNFEGYFYADKNNLLENPDYLQQSLNEGKRIVLFLTLQDLQGENMKNCHEQVFNLDWNLLIVDETHFGARAEHYGKVLENKSSLTKVQINAETERQLEDVDTLDDLETNIKEIRRDVTIHLSGTPYRILMGDEFQKEDIIAFVQFSDIAEAQQKWIEDNKYKEDFIEWENPYYGFPQMIRFAFNPNQTSLDKIAELRANGATTSFAELFRPKSMTATSDNYKKFAHEEVVLDFLKVIDGAKNDSNVLGFLDNERIKKGKLCRHMVMVLPYCASCDAMEEMLETHKQAFRNLGDYEIVNISGLKRNKAFHKTENVKSYISDCESKGKKTITLTVNRMLTGNTVPEWDTMIFLKQTSSPEEYDQAVFRLQNSFIKEYKDDDNQTVKLNMKPQTILVDFDPERIFRLQERKSQIYNINTVNNGNSRLRDRIETELQISPIITLDHNKLRKVTVSNILDAVRNYAATRSILDEAKEMPVDLSLLANGEFRKVIDSLNRIDSNKGIAIPAHENNGEGEDGDDVNPKIHDERSAGAGHQPNDENDDPKSDKEEDITKKCAAYYALILFFAFLTDDRVVSLEDIINVIDASENNLRISGNLGLKKEILQIIQNSSKGYSLNTLDYKIQNTNDLGHDSAKQPLERVKTALTKFGRMSESEIVTPISVAEEMVQLLPDDIFSYGSVLDIASKQGEFTIALLNRYGLEVSDRIYSVCTSKLAYEFTRKVYSLLSLPIDHIFSSFTSYDIIKRDEKTKEFQIPEELKDMNWSTIIGNPPYQEILEEGRSLAKQLFPSFIEVGITLSPKFFSLITPARWFTADAQDNSFPKLRNFVRSNNHFSTIVTRNGKKIFPNTELSMVNYFLWEREYTGNVDFIENFSNSSNILSRPLFEDGMDIIVPQNNIISIIQKIQKSDFTSLNTITTGRDAFGIVGKNFEKRSETNPFKDSVAVQCAYEQIRFIPREQVTKGIDILDSYKVFTSKGNGGAGLLTDDKPVAIIGKSYIGTPGMACTDSLIPFGKFSTIEEAENLQKYMSTKFLRFCVGILKVSQNLYQNVYAFVPLLNFLHDSDIDWSKSVEEIDAQLYTKYNLSDDEISFIESMIKPM